MTEWSRACGFEPALHHQLIIEKLEAVTRGDIKRLAVFLPPGSAKSTYTSVLFPPYFLAQHSKCSILTASHSASLATTFGRRCRNLIDEHGSLLGYTLAKDSQAADDWGTSTQCVYFCAGVGGRIAGHRADLGLIDDPVGSIEDADSQVIRDKIWEWYEWSFLPRLKPGAPIVVISTRWHEDDLMGRLLARQAGKWEVVKIPMEAEENDPIGRSQGDRLWPEYFTDEMVVEAKANTRKWNGAYQQNPNPEAGDYFKSEWLIGYQPEQLPKNLQTYAVGDYACSDRDLKKNDPTLLIPFGLDEGNNIWIYPDIWWNVADTGKIVNQMIETMRRRNPVVWIAETENIVKSIGPFLRTRMVEEEIFTTRIQELPGGRDKSSKARSIQGRMEMGKVFFPKFASWWPRAEHELLTFPVGTHDEWPDALGCIGRYLDMLKGKREVPAKKVVKEMTYGWLLQRHRQKQQALEALKEGLS